MVRRVFERLLLRPEDVLPSQSDLEVIGVFNPGAVLADNQIVLLIRVAERPRQRKPGCTALPRWTPEQGVAVEWVNNDELECADPRVVRQKRDGLVRLTFISHLRVARSRDGRRIDELSDALFVPSAEWEEFGVEDPRLTHVHGKYYFTYVAVSRHGAATALASTKNFQQFERHGIVFCTENKDVVLLSEQIEGRYVALHRPNGATPFTAPAMWIAHSPDLIHWGGHAPLFGGAANWEMDRVGAGAPPLRWDDGWLEIYHGSRPAPPGEVGAYAAGAMLLDRNDPRCIRRRTIEPILVPQADFERRGFVPNVVFPTGAVPKGDTVLVYYGAADTFTAVVELSCREIRNCLK